MAKKPRSRNQTQFHETLAATPGLMRPDGRTLAEEIGRWALKLPLKKVASDTLAVGHDMGRGVGKVWRALTGVRARILYLALALTVFGGSSVLAIDTALDTMKTYGSNLSNPTYIMNSKNTGTTILDRNGEVLYQGYGAVTRHSIPLSEMPDTLKQATLATEDPDFYKHPGFSWRGTVRAAYEDVRQNGKVQGGSTITQQLVKTTLLSNEKSFSRKYKEAVLSVQMEKQYSKDQILEMYLNTIYYGQGAYGVEAASETYFHKPAKDLTLEESTLLAGLPQSPSMFDPNLNLKAATERRNYVLSRMAEHKYIQADQAKTAQATPVVAGTREATIKAPHFVFYVLNQLRQTYGEEMIEKGGITVKTTLDYSKQPATEQIINEQLTKLAGHNATNGALVSVDPRNGDILTMVGSRDYNAPGYGAVNVITAERQPGSSFKPIAYATAFTKGWNGATKVDDKPIELPQGNGTTYKPQNYDQKFRGPVLLRRALANSLNIPAIEVIQHAGIHDTITMAHNLGISPDSLDQENRYGVSLVLGGGEVRPIDMAGVYATLANQGRAVKPRAITQVQDKYSQDITQSTTPNEDKQPHQAIDPRIAYMITNILSDNKAREEEFTPNNPLKLSRPAAAKTGTTNDFRDNWTVGYTPELATAVWVGNNDNTAMTNVDGITGAAPIWHNYMEMMLAGTPPSEFPVPSGVVMAKVCQADGGLVDPSDPSGVTEVFLAENQQTKRCGAGSGEKKAGEDQPKASAHGNKAPQPDAAASTTQQAQGAPAPEAPGMGSGGTDGSGGTGGGGGGDNQPTPQGGSKKPDSKSPVPPPAA
jgi:1A family penicillin-binding protein